MVVEVGLGGLRHTGSWLGPEILDNDLLQVPVALVQVAQRHQRLYALMASLADADQDAGGERHRRLAGRADCIEAQRRVLIGRAEMRPAAAAQPLGGALEHDPLRHRYGTQPLDIGSGHDSGVEMRQEPGLAQHQLGHCGEVGERGLVTEPRQRLARRGVAQFGLVAQCEERLVAAGARPGPGDRQHLIGVEVGGLAAARRVGEGAIVADVAAQLGQRDEDLARIGDEAAMPRIAQCRRGRHQRLRVGTIGERQSVGRGQTLPRRSLGQNVVGGHRPKPPTDDMRSAASTARARVVDSIRIKDTTSSGLSMSRAIPGRCSTFGRRPHASAA